jgi:hypothetical protein
VQKAQQTQTPKKASKKVLPCSFAGQHPLGAENQPPQAPGLPSPTLISLKSSNGGADEYVTLHVVFLSCDLHES